MRKTIFACLIIIVGHTLAFEPVERDVPDGTTEKFCGKIEASTLTKKGTGTYVMVGTNIIESAVYVDEGTLRLGTPTDLDGLLFDLDASSESSLTRDENDLVTRWTSVAGSVAMTLRASSPARTATGLLGNKQGVMLYDENNTPLSFRTTSSVNLSATRSFFMTFNEKNVVNKGMERMWGTDRHNSLYKDYLGIFHKATGDWRFIYAAGKEETNKIYVDGTTAQETDAGKNTKESASLLALTTSRTTGFIDNYYAMGGTRSPTNFFATVGEMLAFSTTLTTDERRAIESHLAWKWKTVRYSPTVSYCGIPFDVAVAVAENAVLDLVGHEIAPSSLENSGTIKDGTITLKSGMSLGNCENITLRLAEKLSSPATIHATSGTFSLEVADNLSGDFELLTCDTSTIPPPSINSSTHSIITTPTGYSIKSKSQSHGTIISLN